MYQNIQVDKFNQRVHLWDDQEGYIQLPLRQYNYGYTKDPRGSKKAIDGKTVRKIKLNRQIREDARDPSKQHLFYETDVPIETRVLIDRYGDSDEPSTGHRELNFDIETEILQGFPDWKNPINKITAIAWHEKLTNQYGVLVLDEENKVKTSVEGNKTVIFTRPSITYNICTQQTTTPISKRYLDTSGPDPKTVGDIKIREHSFKKSTNFNGFEFFIQHF